MLPQVNIHADRRKLPCRPLRAVLPWLLLFMLLAGCASIPRGRLAYDDAVTRMFTDNRVPVDYRYYTTGRTHMPYAIIGLAPDYELVTPWWDPVAPDSREFERSVDFIWLPDKWAHIEPAQGAWILDSNGSKIGLWYSMYPSTYIRVENHQVEIYSPFSEAEE